MRQEESLYLCDLSQDMQEAYSKIYRHCYNIVSLKYEGAELLGKLCKRYGAVVYSYGNIVVLRYHAQIVSAILIYPRKLHVFEFPICESKEDEKKTTVCKRRFIKQISNLYPNSANALTKVTRFYGGLCTND